MYWLGVCGYHGFIILWKFNDFQKVERHAHWQHEIGCQLRQVTNLSYLQFINWLEIVPKCILKRISETLRVLFYKPLGQKCVKLVKALFLIVAALDNNFDDFSFLLFFKVQSLTVFKCLEVIIWRYNGLEYLFLDICSHVLDFGEFLDLCCLVRVLGLEIANELLGFWLDRVLLRGPPYGVGFHWKGVLDHLLWQIQWLDVQLTR